jgi:lactoylglutathione lyase
VGILVADTQRAMAFYRDKLGFVETWRGGPVDSETRWINMRLPGASGDYVEFMLYSGLLTRAQLGSMLHICLEVADVPAAHRALLARGLPDEERYRPRVGRNGRRLFNLFDPDGSRTEVMEPKPAASGNKSN